MDQPIPPIASLVESAPPGELSNVTAAIKSILSADPSSRDSILEQLEPAYEKYNEEQLTTVKLNGVPAPVIISPYNSLGGGRYSDTASGKAFTFDHSTQKASGAEAYDAGSSSSETIRGILKSLSAHATEHYPASAIGVYPVENDSKLAILLVANKYSPNNFWNGRWRSSYIYDPASGSVSGTIKVDVHYYEDGNVRLLTSKDLSASVSPGGGAGEIVKQVALLERKYQEELNRGFTSLSEGAFKGLRRQLPVTRQKVEWDKVGGYRLGQDIGGGRSK